MEAVMMHESLDQAMSPYKSQIRNPRIIQHYPFASMPYENYFPTHFQTVGFPQQAPPPQPPRPFLSRSYPPCPSQPPLLPLPAAAPLRRAVSRSFSGPPSSKKPNHNSRVKDSSTSTTPKKSSKLLNKKLSEQSSKSVTVSSTNPFLKELPKDVVPKVLSVRSSSGGIITDANSSMNKTNSLAFAPKEMRDNHDGYMFSGSVAFTISSPPPSSLPLPTFSLRPKLSCNAEAAALKDPGSATDDLRQILRLP